MNVFPNDYCFDRTFYWPHQVKDDEFCAGLPDNDGDGQTDSGKDSCQGDSGGPLICQSGGKAVLYGVTSWGSGCGVENGAGIYGNVFQVKEWIVSVVRAN